jgi:membrane associated rhomboid family serine protease/Flp pilus assembly protein TadD
MFFAPSGAEEPRPEPARGRLPAVTLVLAAVNVLFWLVVLAVGGVHDLTDLLGGSRYVPALILFGAKVNALIHEGQYWRLVSPMFLHANLLHLAVNSYSLLLLGGFVERLYGRPRFLIIYVMSGIAGNLASYLMNPGLSVGASTALFGLLGTMTVFWWKHRQLMAPEFRQRMGSSLFMLLVLNLGLGAILPVIDIWGHIGGLLGGIGIAAMAESRVAGEAARAREWLPMPLALATVSALLIYTGASIVQNVAEQRPLLVAQAALARGDYDRAIRAFREAVAQHPEVPDLRVELGEALRQARRLPEAAAVYRELLRRQPGNRALMRDLVGILLEQRDFAAAIDLIKSLRQRDPDDGQLDGLLFQALFGAKRWDELAALLRRQLRDDPENSQLSLALADVLMKATRWDEAAAIYRKLLASRPTDPLLLNNLAYLYADGMNSNLDEALRMARQATMLAPRESSFWDTLAWVYYRQGRWDDAYRAQREAVLLKPDEAEIRFHMGAIREARGETAAAREEYRESLKLDPSLQPAAAALRRLERPLRGLRGFHPPANLHCPSGAHCPGGAPEA